LWFLSRHGRSVSGLLTQGTCGFLLGAERGQTNMTEICALVEPRKLREMSKTAALLWPCSHKTVAMNMKKLLLAE
jgi:hypothetical protein